jgi:hypothetical protein
LMLLCRRSGDLALGDWALSSSMSRWGVCAWRVKPVPIVVLCRLWTYLGPAGRVDSVGLSSLVCSRDMFTPPLVDFAKWSISWAAILCLMPLESLEFDAASYGQLRKRQRAKTLIVAGRTTGRNVGESGRSEASVKRGRSDLMRSLWMRIEKIQISDLGYLTNCWIGVF